MQAVDLAVHRPTPRPLYKVAVHGAAWRRSESLTGLSAVVRDTFSPRRQSDSRQKQPHKERKWCSRPTKVVWNEDGAFLPQHSIDGGRNGHCRSAAGLGNETPSWMGARTRARSRRRREQPGRIPSSTLGLASPPHSSRTRRAATRAPGLGLRRSLVADRTAPPRAIEGALSSRAAHLATKVRSAADHPIRAMACVHRGSFPKVALETPSRSRGIWREVATL